MKFLIDRCAGKVVADWLRGAGHDVLEARERGADPGDRVLLEWATTDFVDRVCVSASTQVQLLKQALI